VIKVIWDFFEIRYQEITYITITTVELIHLIAIKKTPTEVTQVRVFLSN